MVLLFLVGTAHGTPTAATPDRRYYCCRFSMEGAIMAERTRQHREMRLKGNAELKERVEELKVKLQTERERMQKDFEGQV